MSPYDDRIEFRRGIPESCREEAARVFDEAFGSKFRGAVDKEKRLLLFRETLQLEHGIGAFSEGKLLGIAGLETEAGSLSGGFTFAKFVECLGFLRAAWSMMVLSLFHSKLQPGELHLDELAVSKEARGRGIGSRLLDEVEVYARENGFSAIRLEVVDSNSRARSLYARRGFQEKRTESFPYLRWFFGFGGYTSMVLRLDSRNVQPL